MDIILFIGEHVIEVVRIFEIKVLTEGGLEMWLRSKQNVCVCVPFL